VKRPLTLTIAALAACLLAYAGYRVFWPDEGGRLRAAMNALAGIASTPEAEGDLPRIARVQRIRGYMIEDVLVQVEGGPVFGGREAIVGALATASAVGPVRVRFADVMVDMDADQRRATVTATVELEQPDPRSGVAILDAREVEMTWVRPESSWMLSAAKVVRPLK
jgi:hypothetical protein